MARIILLIAVGIFAYVAWQKFRSSPARERRKLLQWTLVALALAAVLLAISGRLHWVGAAVAVALPVLGKALGWLGRHLPWLAPLIARQAQAGNRQQDRQSTDSNGAGPPPMTADEARRLLDVRADASREDIVSAHRRLIQKLHPDRGGSDYLASQLNAAKELLLHNL